MFSYYIIKDIIVTFMVNELEKLPIANKSNKIYERELQLNKYIDEIQEQIKKYQLYQGIQIIEK